jgi:hypothetical protein
MWHFIFETAPKDCDVLLAVLDHDGFHALEFPCRRGDDGRWIDVTNKQPPSRGKSYTLARVAL